MISCVFTVFTVYYTTQNTYSKYYRLCTEIKVGQKKKTISECKVKKMQLKYLTCVCMLICQVDLPSIFWCCVARLTGYFLVLNMDKSAVSCFCSDGGQCMFWFHVWWGYKAYRNSVCVPFVPTAVITIITSAEHHRPQGHCALQMRDCCA